ncbi:MAG TPA: efflux RND transporter periplasmic adaptor subunit [Candidatus Jorgensenbacteria bacterium]|nr:efflux RND transporter periplasmic adaptor subunit [Candidatus Jorgensenbacteria bacterium]
MEKSLSRRKKSKRKKIIIVAVAIIVLVIAIRMSFKDDKQITYSTIVAERADLIQEISATGRVEAIESIDLAFENSGRVAKAYVTIGDKVYSGQVLVVLENLEETAQIAQAEATLAKNKAKLAELKRGVRLEEIQVQEVKVTNAETALEDAERKLIDELRDAYTKADDAVRNKTDQFFDNPQSPNSKLNFVTSYQLKNSIESGRLLVESILQEWIVSLDILTIGSSLDVYADEANQNLAQIKSFLDNVGLAVNGLISSSDITQTTIDAWKLDVFTGRTNVNKAIANITAAEEKVEDAKSDLALAEQELTLKKSGTIEEQIIAQEAQVKESEANIQYYQAQLKKSIIRSPINGIVTVQDAKVGAIVPANTTVVSVISDGEYQIEALVVEADIANLEVGDVATFSLDAYGDGETFRAIVVKIDPAAELLEGVANYRTTLQLEEEDSRIRPGMTADLDIVTAERENIIVIPQRVVIFKNSLKLVRVLREGGLVEEIEVETGIIGNRGLIEIVSGIEEGDVVITAIKD